MILCLLQDRLVEEVGIDAIICLQSELCHEALQIRCSSHILCVRSRAVTSPPSSKMHLLEGSDPFNQHTPASML